MVVPVSAVESSNLAGVGYDVELEVLAVEFKPRSGKARGPVFHYHGVKPDTFENMLNAVSIGSFYAKNIKGKFSAERMTGPCSECQDEGPIGAPCQCGAGAHRALETRYPDPR